MDNGSDGVAGRLTVHKDHGFQGPRDAWSCLIYGYARIGYGVV